MTTIYTFGNKNKPIALFLPGGFSHWSWYKQSIDSLADKYTVLAVAYSGYTPESDDPFISIEQTVKEITAYLDSLKINTIELVYGLSMGGAVAVRLLAEKKFIIKHAIVDGGITPYQLPKFLIQLIYLKDFYGIRLLRSCKWLIKKVFPAKTWIEAGQNAEKEYQKMQDFLNTLSTETLKNCFYSTNNYSMPSSPVILDTKMVYWYGSHEKYERKLDIAYIRKMLPQAIFSELPNLQHGELVMMKPEQFATNVFNFINSEPTVMNERKIKHAYKQSKNIYDDVLTQKSCISKLYINLFWGVSDWEIANKVLANIPDNFSGKLLDVPVGTAVFTISKYSNLKLAQITCIDFSQDMLEQAKKRFEEARTQNIKCIRGDVGNLMFDDEHFDIVLSMNGFHAFPDKTKAFDETARVLKKGGCFIGCFYIKKENRRTDFIVKTVLSKKGWFTPPFYTKNELELILKERYKSVELHNEKAMVWFKCTK